MQLLVLVDGNAAAVVLDGDGIVLIDGHFDVSTIAGHRLVDGVVYCLIDKMMETFLTDVSNVHGRTLANSFQTFQHLYVFR